MESPRCLSTPRQNCTFCAQLIFFFLPFPLSAILIVLGTIRIINRLVQKNSNCIHNCIFRPKKYYVFFSVFYPSVTSKGIKWKQHWQNKKLLSCVAVNCDFSSSVKEVTLGKVVIRKTSLEKPPATLKPKRLFLKRWFSERRKRKGVPSISLP